MSLDTDFDLSDDVDGLAEELLTGQVTSDEVVQAVCIAALEAGLDPDVLREVLMPYELGHIVDVAEELVSDEEESEAELLNVPDVDDDDEPEDSEYDDDEDEDEEDVDDEDDVDEGDEVEDESEG